MIDQSLTLRQMADRAESKVATLRAELQRVERERDRERERAERLATREAYWLEYVGLLSADLKDASAWAVLRGWRSWRGAACTRLRSLLDLDDYNNPIAALHGDERSDDNANTGG